MADPYRAMGRHSSVPGPVGVGGLRHTREDAEADARRARADGWSDAWVEEATWLRGDQAEWPGAVIERLTGERDRLATVLRAVARRGLLPRQVMVEVDRLLANMGLEGVARDSDLPGDQNALPEDDRG